MKDGSKSCHVLDVATIYEPLPAVAGIESHGS